MHLFCSGLIAFENIFPTVFKEDNVSITADRIYNSVDGRTLFIYLVASIMLYASVIWGWKLFPKLEQVQRKFFRWIRDLSWRVPHFVVTEELKLKNVEIQSLKRAPRYEARISYSSTWLLVSCSMHQKYGAGNWSKYKENFSDGPCIYQGKSYTSL